jgi:hypothetical protein
MFVMAWGVCSQLAYILLLAMPSIHFGKPLCGT